jgi:mannose-6-phosphate isomerase
MEIYNVIGEIEESTDGSKFYIYLFIEGEASVDSFNNTISVKAGESIFIPAAMGKFTIKGSFKALKMYVPDLQSDVVFPLTEAGHTLKEIQENVYN